MAAPRWRRATLRRKFLQHRHEFEQPLLGPPVRTEDAYEESSLVTIGEGVRFTYTDRQRGQPRVGYYDPLSQRFTAVTENERWIVTHFPAADDYVRHLPDSDYG